jgi:hypothetical protein
MSRPTIDQLRAVGTVTQLFRWNVIFAAFPKDVAAPPSSDDLNLRCESSTLPKLGSTPLSVKIRGHVTKQPGIHTYNGTIDLVFIETVDNVVHNFLKAWRDICWAPHTGVQSSKANSEASILLQRLDNQDNPIWQYKLIGAILEDYEAGGPLNADGQDGLKPKLTIGYDLFDDQPLP